MDAIERALKEMSAPGYKNVYTMEEEKESNKLLKKIKKWNKRPGKKIIKITHSGISDIPVPIRQNFKTKSQTLQDWKDIYTEF